MSCCVKLPPGDPSDGNVGKGTKGTLRERSGNRASCDWVLSRDTAVLCLSGSVVVLWFYGEPCVISTDGSVCLCVCLSAASIVVV